MGIFFCHCGINSSFIQVNVIHKSKLTLATRINVLFVFVLFCCPNVSKMIC